MKSASLTLSEAAAADIVEQADWYREQSGPALAKRWERAVTSALLRILHHPRAGAPQGLKPTFLAALGGTTKVLHPSKPKPGLLGTPVVPFPKTYF